MKKTWEGIREVIGRQKKHRKSISAVRANSSSPLDPSKIVNIMNFQINHAFTYGEWLLSLSNIDFVLCFLHCI